MKPPQILFNQQDSMPVVMIYHWKVLYLLAIELYNFVGLPGNTQPTRQFLDVYLMFCVCSFVYSSFLLNLTLGILIRQKFLTKIYKKTS